MTNQVTGEEVVEVQGVVDKDRTKGGKFDLSVHAGEKLDIIRTQDTPKGKWVVKNSEGACKS